MSREQTEYQKSQRIQQEGRKSTLFSAAACQPGLWGKTRYPHVLHESYTAENLHASLRQDSVDYFARRNIPWQGDGSNDTLPTGNLCSSQVLCANTLFPLARRPDQLVALLADLGFNARRVLPIPNDLPSGREPEPVHFIGFEWHEGAENFLQERGGSSRPRGAYATSADFTVLLERTDGRKQLLLGEWKYSEAYDDTSKQFSDRGTDRATIYEHALRSEWNPIHWEENDLEIGDLMFDPFDQLMRLQLLAAAIEHHWPDKCDAACLLWVLPSANHALSDTVTSPALRRLAERASIPAKVSSVWTYLVGSERFRSLATETLVGHARAALADCEPEWAHWMSKRYGDLR